MPSYSPQKPLPILHRKPGKMAMLFKSMAYLLMAAWLLLASTAHAQEWLFDVFLDGKAIGQHDFVLSEGDGTQQLTSSADFKVKILFVEAYRYRHVAKEQWKADCLLSLDARTQENKEITQVQGSMRQGNFTVEMPVAKKPIPSQTLPACSMSFAYWNPNMLKQNKLLNPQTGEWLDVKIRSLGSESIQVRGQEVQAEHYKLEARKMKIDLWYSPSKEWLALTSTTPEGYAITYKLR